MRNWTWLGLLAASAGLLLAGRASAQECASNADCMRGYSCEVTASSGCGFACADDGNPCVPPPDFSCETMEFRSCVPGPCTSDADCADGMVCFEQESFDCAQTDFACPPGAECLKPAPEPCTATVHASCVPQYVPPCAVDADCGDGFACVEDISFSCSGSAPSSGGGSDPVPGGAAGSPAPTPVPERPAPECTEQPLGTFHCEVVETVCASDADCVEGWTCLDVGVPPVSCTSAGPAMPTTPPVMMSPASCPGAIPAICRLCADNSCGQPVCQSDGTWKHVCPEDEGGAGFAPPADDRAAPPPECMVDPSFVPTRLCTPPFFDVGWDVAASSGPGAMGSEPGSASGTPTSSAPPSVDEDSAGSDDDAPTVTTKGESASEEMEPMTSESCAVRAPGTGSGSALALGLLGLSVLGLRRRNRS